MTRGAGNAGNDKAGRDAKGERRPPERTAAEWAIFAVSALLILTVVAVLVVDWAQHGSAPPAFRTTVRAVRLVPGGYQVPVEVQNVGEQAAAEVRVEARLDVGGEVTDAEQTIDFLAPEEDMTVTFVFEHDPRNGALSASVTAFSEP